MDLPQRWPCTLWLRLVHNIKLSNRDCWLHACCPMLEHIGLVCPQGTKPCVNWIWSLIVEKWDIRFTHRYREVNKCLDALAFHWLWLGCWFDSLWGLSSKFVFLVIFWHFGSCISLCLSKKWVWFIATLISSELIRLLLLWVCWLLITIWVKYVHSSHKIWEF